MIYRWEAATNNGAAGRSIAMLMMIMPTSMTIRILIMLMTISRVVWSRSRCVLLGTPSVWGRFYFKELSQPPNILPISWICACSRRYFLSSIIIRFLSIRINIFSASNLRLACLSVVAFSCLFCQRAAIKSSSIALIYCSHFAPSMYLSFLGKSSRCL